MSIHGNSQHLSQMVSQISRTYDFDRKFLEKRCGLSASLYDNLTVYLSNEFYDRAKAWLTAENSKEIEGLSTSDVATTKRKKWTLQHGKTANPDGKFIIPKHNIFKTLCEAHSAIAHRGRDKTERYTRESHAEISQEVITLFVSLCKLHQQQRSVTNHVKKPVIKPLMADGFLKHVEIDLIDFLKLPCPCNATHKWVRHITDHFSKFTWLYPLHSNETEEVVEALEKQFYLFGFPTILHADNGREFKSKKMTEFCKAHKIKQVH